MGEAVGVVLAGGRSSRMGRDKARVIVGGRTLAARAVELLGRACAEVVVADGGRGVVPGARSVPDGPGRGPAAGLLGAARAVPGRPVVALACDLPAVPEALLAALAGGKREWAAADLVLPRGPRGLEPLVARYGPRALAALEEQVAAGEYAPRYLLERTDLEVVIVEVEELAGFGDPERMFWNVNTPEELARVLGEGDEGDRR
jgi:molybdopterin-guanine dinucleotide biosynthesis protein A